VLLVVCPNLAIDRILQVDHFQATKVQRTRSVLTQPGGKGSNVARVFRQLGGDVVLVGFVGKANAELIRRPLQHLGIKVDLVIGYPGESRTCTVVCDPQSPAHPTVINEESSPVDATAGAKLLARVNRWISRVDAVLTTGSLATGLPDHFYAQILEYARRCGKLTAIDAAGDALRLGLQTRPTFTKPNREEFFHLTNGSHSPGVFTLASHHAVTFGRAGALLIHEGKCIYASPPRVFDTNPIGSGDAFAAAYLKYLLDSRPATDCLRFALAAAASDAATLRPGYIEVSQFQSLVEQVELQFLNVAARL
jgi:1-phosphofructokinase family hexose kinase